MSSSRPDTRRAILEAAREMFGAQGYHGAGLEAVAKKAGVSRQAIYLHFGSKADLLTALHLHIFETDVVPALARHPIWTAASPRWMRWTRLSAPTPRSQPACGGSTRRWWLARRHHPEVEETLRPREAERYARHRTARALVEEGRLPPGRDAGARVRRHLLGTDLMGTFVNLVIERGWSLEQYERWVRPDRPASDRGRGGAELSRRCRRRPARSTPSRSGQVVELGRGEAGLLEDLAVEAVGGLLDDRAAGRR